MKQKVLTCKRMRVCFSGTVQGVGFRYTVVRIARDFSVDGFVRNEMDGTVLLVAEGGQEELSAFLQAVNVSHVGRYIHQALVGWAEATGEYDGFDIDYHSGRSVW